uniref:Uncharacterized protein n=1 Tax=viral metagenome TaxID=1070528 RepID=A0A6C0B559_9ZZZZ
MPSLKIEERFPHATRVQIELLVEKYNIPSDWIEEIKEKWQLDVITGYYCKPGSKYDIGK